MVYPSVPNGPNRDVFIMIDRKTLIQLLEACFENPEDGSLLVLSDFLEEQGLDWLAQETRKLAGTHRDPGVTTWSVPPCFGSNGTAVIHSYKHVIPQRLRSVFIRRCLNKQPTGFHHEKTCLQCDGRGWVLSELVLQGR